GLEGVLRAMEAGEIRVAHRDLTEPSPLALEILSARPYAFLDDAPLEERRTHAVMSRRWLDEETAAGLGRLDPEAIERVRAEAWPTVASADELHDALLGLGFLTAPDVAGNPGWQALLEELALARRATRIRIGTGRDVQLWVAAERLPQFAAVYGPTLLEPPIEAPAEFARRTWSREEALIEIVRGRLEALGPVTAQSLADSLAVSRVDIDAALAKLAAEGFAMRGAFTAGGDMEWCERALLARIHRYTVKRLRAEIEPVSAQDFMRFLSRWQHAIPAERREGPDALAALVTQLEGFEAPAAAWEAEILPSRLDNYDFTWLDDLCLAGRAAWTRLTVPPSRSAGAHAGPIRTTPVTLVPRRNLALWHRAVPAVVDASSASARGQRVAEYLKDHGACFYDEIVEGTGMLRTQVEDSLAELVVVGLVHSDSFAGLRALLTPSDRRKPLGEGRRRRRTALFGIEDAGRWALVRRPAPRHASIGGVHDAEAEVVEHVAHTLLRRYGVVFWRLLEREAAWLPPWRDLLRVLRRFEARGEIRGGRFVAGMTGEQFALPEAVAALRETRRAAVTGAWISLSAADPLNLAGTIVPGPKVPALTHNRVLYRDGIGVAALVGGEVQWIVELEARERREAESALIRRQAGSPLLSYLSR
ncbi:MAG TPA: ATP-dependent DNA helicase, partial [Casimicrobiaceae bacterium]|nr:ATP-dependent DNA helicase [Casimicrobiaceae bacterium]